MTCKLKRHDTNECIHKTETDSQIQRNGFMVAGGGRMEGSELGSLGWKVHTASLKWTATSTCCVAQETHKALWQPGWEGSLGKSRYICICMAESPCQPETITLLIGYTLCRVCKNKFKKRMNWVKEYI